MACRSRYSNRAREQRRSRRGDPGSGMQRHLCLFMGLLIPLLAGCAAGQTPRPVEATPRPDQATGTAVVGSKYTEAAKLTREPMTAAPTAQFPAPTEAWTPSPQDGISANDSGKAFEIWITSRIAILLNGAEYPMADLTVTCTPNVVLGRVTNIPPVPAPFYVIRYEAVDLGECTIRNGQFHVSILVVSHP